MERSLHQMYSNIRHREQTELKFIDFEMPFGKKLREDNRWVKMAKLIPWQEFEHPYQSRLLIAR